MKTLTCERCLQPYQLPQGRKATRFCSKSCSVKSRWEQPEYAAKILPSLRDKSDLARATASARMKRMNKDEAFREKSDAARRGLPFAGTRGGNGQLTSAQVALAAALGSGWSTEYPVTTGDRSWSCAMLDLALPTLKLAVECDGNSHLYAKQADRDSRKTAILAGLGWTVLRFRNARITEDLPGVVAEIDATACGLAASIGSSK